MKSIAKSARSEIAWIAKALAVLAHFWLVVRSVIWAADAQSFWDWYVRIGICVGVVIILLSGLVCLLAAMLDKWVEGGAQ